MKSFLVIQGPMLSYFSQYCPAVAGPETRELDGKLVFDATSNVQRIVENYGKHFDQIVLSTWDDQEVQNLKQLESLGVGVIQTPSRSVAHLPNWAKQIVGVCATEQAFLNLQKDDRVTKVRTDLWVDLTALLTHIDQADATFDDWQRVNQRGFIHVLNSRGPYYLEDMIVSARAQDFFRFWRASTFEQQAFPGNGIHSSLPLEYAWKERNNLGIEAREFLDYYRWVSPWRRSDAVLHQDNLWKKLLGSCFCLLPEIDPANFVWRGQPSNHQTNRNRFKRYQFHEQWLLARQHPHPFALLTDLNYFCSRAPKSLKSLLYATRKAIRARNLIRRNR